MIISETLEALPSKPCLRDFSETYLEAIPPSTLESKDVPSLVSFLKERFSFFSESAAAGVGTGVFRFINDPKKPNKVILDIVCTDASYIIVTVEALFREYQIPVTRLFHPIFSVEVKNKALHSVAKASVGKLLMSSIYIECENTLAEFPIDKLTRRLERHLSAIHYSYRDQKSIYEMLNTLKKDIQKHSFALAEPKEEWANLLDWLGNGNFSFYGYMAFDQTDKKSEPQLKSGLGILASENIKHDSKLLEHLVAHNEKEIKGVFQLDTLKLKSPIQRFENLMRLTLNIPNGKGKTVNHVFLGLLKRSSLFVKNIETPLIHLKMKSIYKAKNMIPGSYDYIEVVRLFTAIPKFELFRTSTEQLLKMVEELLSITNPNDVYVLDISKPKSNQLFLVVAMPFALFSQQNSALISNYVQSTIANTGFESLDVISEEKCRIHMHLEVKKDVSYSKSSLEQHIRQLVRPWVEKLKHTLLDQLGEGEGSRLFAKYAGAFPSHYQISKSTQQALIDIRFLEKAAEAGLPQCDLQAFVSEGSSLTGKASVLSIYNPSKMDLISVMPILQNLGLHVYDELTISVGPKTHIYGFIHMFRVAHANHTPIEEGVHKEPLLELLQALFNQRTENDPLNALLLKAGLNWRAINVVQTYRNFLLQVSSAYTREKLNATLVNYSDCTKKLFHYFEARFKPDAKLGSPEKRLSTELPKAKQAVLESLSAVDEVSDDLVLRHFLNLMESSLRTNFYIPKPNGETCISVKFLSQSVKDMPLPTPFKEIYVHDVGVEGTHLRFGPVARGGIRWSDRPDDFRKEILSLVKTQQVKNVVIVPVGSKGGFVLKKKLTTREEAATESVNQYRLFIKSLLDITDTVSVSGTVTHPENVVHYDGEDPYLVVAADKGTASFSDIANGVSDDYHFWLGDAFASGGSVGYNHKDEAITARGAWECTKLHFKELGKDLLKETVTVAGIGDMSGDVFGNGMLLSKLLKLQAAFNHIHIFLDPDPDPASSWKERKRLFDLPRSTWKDYNPKLISKGGGVFDRKAKEITLSAEVKKMLDVKEDVLTGEEVIKAILRMKVELLWFGGIGTYIKATSQSHTQVGDAANDVVRIDAPECRALVVAEGANLGVTQLGRIELSRRGVSINTDAIDNSAGVNMSDYEVNIKILLKRMLEEKRLKTMADRNKVLAEATDEVSLLVLANNQGQHQMLTMDMLRSQKQGRVFVSLIDHLISHNFLDPKTENIPSIPELEQWVNAKQVLPRPILAVVQAYVKMEIYNQLCVSSLLDHPVFDTLYVKYFPESIQKKFSQFVHSHRLKREILATSLTNRIINQAGMCFYYQVQQSSGKSIDEITLAYVLADSALNGEAIRSAIKKEATSQLHIYTALSEFETLVQRFALELLQLPITVSLDDTDKLKQILEKLKPSLTVREARLSKWKQLGFSAALAQQLACAQLLGIGAEVFFLHQHAQLKPDEAFHLINHVNAAFELDWVKQQLQHLELSNPWDLAQRDSLQSHILSRKVSIIECVLKTTPKAQLTGLKPKDIVHTMGSQWIHGTAPYFDTLTQLKSSAGVGLSSVAVCLSRLG